MSESTFQEKILERLSEHSVLLATISVDISNLKGSDVMSNVQYKELEARIRAAEKLIIYSWAVTAVILAKLGLPYLLK